MRYSYTIINFVRICIRNIQRQMVFSLINIASLTIGLTCVIFIALWIQEELNYDQFHINKKNLYRIISKTDDAQDKVITTSPLHLVPQLKKDFPEIVHYTRFGLYGSRIRYGDRSYKVYNRFGVADPTFFKMFTIPFVLGDPETALADTDNVVITHTMSEMLFFEHENPIGKNIILDNESELTVTGVLQDIPRNSQFKFDFLSHIGVLSEKHIDPGEFTFYSYVLLPKNVSVDDFNKKMDREFKKTNITPKETRHQPLLQKFTEIRADQWDVQGRIKNITILSLIGIFMMFVAGVNYINLTTAHSGNRVKEIGMRKVIGATRWDMIKQFFGESIVLSFIALGFAIILAELLSPFFNDISGKDFPTILSGNISIIIGLIIFTFFTGILAGFYPALVLSAFQPTDIFKGCPKRPRRKQLRAMLVTFQFAIAIGLIIATITIYWQINFIKNKDLGFNKDSILIIPYNLPLISKIELYREKLMDNPNILDVSAASNLPVDIERSLTMQWEGGPVEGLDTRYILVDHHFIDVFEIDILEGRNFLKGSIKDMREGFIINETACDLMELENSIGTPIFFGEPDSRYYQHGNIIGVIKDFHFHSLRQKMGPIFMRIYPSRFTHIFIKMKQGSISSTMDFIEQISKVFSPNVPFEFSFLDDAVTDMYITEKQLGKLINHFSLLAITIACFGLTGLALFLTEQRNLEISVRKVFGASVTKITYSLLSEFIKWLLVANVITWPVAYYVMNEWLQNFAYRINMRCWIFLLSGTLVLVIAMVTVGFQAIRAAIANPVDALKYE